MAKKRPKRTLVWIRWYDASYQRGECSEDDLVPKVEIESAGLLIREDEEFISLALDRYENDHTWRYIEHIPKVNVRAVKKMVLV